MAFVVVVDKMIPAAVYECRQIESWILGIGLVGALGSKGDETNAAGKNSSIGHALSTLLN